MKTRAFAACAAATTAALAIAVVPANATSSSTSEPLTFGSGSGLSARSDVAVQQLPSMPSIQQQKAAPSLVGQDLLTRYYVRGYQSLNDTYSSILGDVDVSLDPSQYCYILSNMKVNGSDRDDPAITYAGAYRPSDPFTSGGAEVPITYGAATYQFGPHYFFDAGADEECYTDDDDFMGLSDTTLSNAVRIRYATKGVVQFSSSGKNKKVHVLAQRYDRSDRYVRLGSVKLQYRAPGTTTWKTKKTITLDSTGRADYRFSTSKRYYYRIAVVRTDNVESSYSPQRVL